MQIKNKRASPGKMANKGRHLPGKSGNTLNNFGLICGVLYRLLTVNMTRDKLAGIVHMLLCDISYNREQC